LRHHVAVDFGARVSGQSAAMGLGMRPGARRTATPRAASPAAAAPIPTDVGDLSAVVELAQRGDEQAFRVLYRVLQPRLLRYLRGLVGNEAEDVASDSWLQIVRHLASFRGDFEAFRGWAATIARNRAMDHLRRQNRRLVNESPIEQFAELPCGNDVAADALDLVSTDAAIALIARLPRDQAEAVLLRVVMGLDAQNAARVLGKRPGAVRTAAYRGVRRLAEYLSAARSPGPDRSIPEV
jgi:RNA polymerase sigma-70 factor, ECF subfamily